MFIKVTNQSDEELKINTEQIVIMFDKDKQVTFSNGFTIAMNDESYARINDLYFRDKKKKSDEPKTELNELFDKLHRLVGGKGKAVFTLNREKKLKELLTKHRMTEENLITAATNIGIDKWLQGENDNKKRYGDVDYLLRPDKAAKYAEEQEKKKKGMF